jgi:hypothetical protein
MYKFVILDIQTNKIIFLFLKYRPSSHGFHKLVIKSKNTCKYINKTIFLIFLFKDDKSFHVFFLWNMIIVFWET